MLNLRVAHNSPSLLLGVLALSSTLLLSGSSDKKTELNDLRTQGYLAYTAGSFQTASNLYNRGYELAKGRGDNREASRFLSNLASIQRLFFKYQEALNTYLVAKKLAHSLDSGSEESLIDLNLADLYMQLGDMDAANRYAKSGLAGFGKSAPYHYQLLACLGALSARQGETARSISYLLDAIVEAGQPRVWTGTSRRDLNSMALDWDVLGEELLLKKHFEAAEYALNESLRLRTLFNKRDLRLSIVRLSWLRLEQGNLDLAEKLMLRAEAMPGNDLGFPSWLSLYLRGQILQRNGNPSAALKLYRPALAAAREFQEQAAPGSAPGVYAQQRLAQLYSDIVETSLQLDKSGLDGFQATEDDRAVALKQSVAGTEAMLKRIPSSYWAKLAEFRAAQARQLAPHGSSTGEDAAKLGVELDQMRAKSGLAYFRPISTTYSEKNTARGTLRSIQQGLGAEEALLSFHVGRESSALWAVTRERIELYRLRPERELSRRIVDFRNAVEHRRENRDSLGELLYSELFKELDPEFQRKRVWIVSAEDAFFGIPMAALVTGNNEGRPVYLMERHVLMQTPSAALLTSAPLKAPGGPFIGLGDGIYNTADPRWTRSGWNRPGSFLGSFSFFRQRPPPLELARLAGSGKEISACAQTWGARPLPILLTGANASVAALRTAVLSHASVIHIASHFVNVPEHPGEAVIDLGLTPEGNPELLNERDIATLQTPDATVVMSGCSSGDSRAIPTSGVLGLTRAWLIAGARAVIGSRWPTSDDTGELFRSFYLHLREVSNRPERIRSVAESLTTAQLEMLHSGTWRSDPYYWGAFYVVGKE